MLNNQQNAAYEAAQQQKVLAWFTTLPPEAQSKIYYIFAQLENPQTLALKLSNACIWLSYHLQSEPSPDITTLFGVVTGFNDYAQAFNS